MSEDFENEEYVLRTNIYSETLEELQKDVESLVKKHGKEARLRIVAGGSAVEYVLTHAADCSCKECKRRRGHA